MVSVTRAVFIVFKTTGGRLWNKPWGRPGMTQTMKANRKKNLLQEAQVVCIDLHFLTL